MDVSGCRQTAGWLTSVSAGIGRGGAVDDQATDGRRSGVEGDGVTAHAHLEGHREVLLLSLLLGASRRQHDGAEVLLGRVSAQHSEIERLGIDAPLDVLGRLQSLNPKKKKKKKETMIVVVTVITVDISTAEIRRRRRQQSRATSKAVARGA